MLTIHQKWKVSERNYSWKCSKPCSRCLPCTEIYSSKIGKDNWVCSLNLLNLPLFDCLLNWSTQHWVHSSAHSLLGMFTGKWGPSWTNNSKPTPTIQIISKEANKRSQMKMIRMEFFVVQDNICPHPVKKVLTCLGPPISNSWKVVKSIDLY